MFLAAICAFLIIVAVVGLGRTLDSAKGKESPWMFPLILVCCGLVLFGRYYSDVHPIIGNTLSIVTGSLVGYCFLLGGSLLVRFVLRAMQQ